MSSINGRKPFGTLSLVAGPSAGEPIPADGHARLTLSIPDQWFCDEVGYISETAADAGAAAWPQRSD